MWMVRCDLAVEYQLDVDGKMRTLAVEYQLDVDGKMRPLAVEYQLDVDGKMRPGSRIPTRCGW